MAEKAAVVVRRLLQGSTFEPEAINTIVQAYEATLAKLRLANIEDAVTRLVAEKIIEVAQTGERDPVRICERTIGALGPQ